MDRTENRYQHFMQEGYKRGDREREREGVTKIGFLSRHQLSKDQFATKSRYSIFDVEERLF